VRGDARHLPKLPKLPSLPRDSPALALGDKIVGNLDFDRIGPPVWSNQ
jgi:hypothetical protein